MDPRLTTRYGLAKPAATHRRPATCDEVHCRSHINGWRIRVMPNTDLGRKQVALIRHSGRRFIVTHEDGSDVYTFEAGQQCFGAHSVPIDREAIYLVRQGAQPVKRHVRPADWVDDFSSHLDKIREQ